MPTKYDETFYRAMRRIGAEREKRAAMQGDCPCNKCHAKDTSCNVCLDYKIWFKTSWDRMCAELRRKLGYYADRSDGA